MRAYEALYCYQIIKISNRLILFNYNFLAKHVL